MPDKKEKVSHISTNRLNTSITCVCALNRTNINKNLSYHFNLMNDKVSDDVFYGYPVTVTASSYTIQISITTSDLEALRTALNGIDLPALIDNSTEITSLKTTAGKISF